MGKRSSYKLALFIIYFIIFLTSFSLINYYAYSSFNPKLLILFSLIFSIFATYFHLKQRQKTKADELAKEIERIL